MAGRGLEEVRRDWSTLGEDLAEFLRVLRPGGTAVVQRATRTLWTVPGLAARRTDSRDLRLILYTLRAG